MSLRDADWWVPFVTRLQEEPLNHLIVEYDLDEESVVLELTRSGTSRALIEQLWWPEVVRQHHDGVPLREIARRFHTRPRRLRRNLARAGIRVNGVDIEDGVPSLAPYRARLGLEPDKVIAAEAGVTVEAVQGERRRLDIDPYSPHTPKPAPKSALPPESRADVDSTGDLPPIADEVPPIADDLPPIVDDLPPIVDDLPLSADDRFDEGPAPSPRPKPRARSTQKRAVTRTRRRVRRPESVEVLRRPAPSRPAEPARQTRRRRVVARPKLANPDVLSTLPNPRAEEDPTTPDRRRGRKRIVRPDPIRPEMEAVAEPEPPKPRRQRKVASPHGEVREIDVSAIDPSELIPPPEPADTPASAAPPVVKKAAFVAPPPPTPEPTPEPSRASIAAEPVKKTPSKKTSRVVRPTARSSVKPRVKPAVKPAPKVAKPTPKVSAKPAPKPRTRTRRKVSPPPASDASQIGWRIRLDGKEHPMVVRASNIVQATQMFVDRLGEDALRRASIYQAGN
ncbi:MAG: hypothetical protein AAFV53_26510 [Myxococcota bacterium]